jgi:hypothetical protein
MQVPQPFGAHCQAEELEVGPAPGRLDDAVHAQARRIAVALRLDEVAEAVKDVVHAHDGGGRDGVLDDGVTDPGVRVGQDRRAQARVARSDRAGDRHAPALLG